VSYLLIKGAKIERSCELGQSIRAIAKETKFAPSTVQNTLNTNPHRNEAVTLKSSGRPKKYTNETHVKFLNLFELILSLHTQIIDKILIFTSGASLMTLSVAFSLPLELRIGEQKEDRH
jgi:transposase